MDGCGRVCGVLCLDRSGGARKGPTSVDQVEMRVDIVTKRCAQLSHSKTRSRAVK
jgi:hypothetical protein